MALRLGMIVFRNTVCSSSDERHQVNVVPALDDDGVTFRVRMLEYVEQVTALDVEHDVLEADAGSFLSVAFFASSQAKYFTHRYHVCVCSEGTPSHREECAQKCAPTRRDGHPPAANGIQETNGKRPEIVDFRPVL